LTFKTNPEQFFKRKKRVKKGAKSSTEDGKAGCIIQQKKFQLFLFYQKTKLKQEKYNFESHP